MLETLILIEGDINDIIGSVTFGRLRNIHPSLRKIEDFISNNLPLLTNLVHIANISIKSNLKRTNTLYDVIIKNVDECRDIDLERMLCSNQLLKVQLRSKDH